VIDVVERVIGREIDDQVHHDLVDEAISALRNDDGGATG
jgi:hypothetical protein